MDFISDLFKLFIALVYILGIAPLASLFTGELFKVIKKYFFKDRCNHDYKEILRSYVQPIPFYGIRFNDTKEDEEIGYTNILKKCDICKKETTTRILGKII